MLALIAAYIRRQLEEAMGNAEEQRANIIAAIAADAAERWSLERTQP